VGKRIEIVSEGFELVLLTFYDYYSSRSSLPPSLEAIQNIQFNSAPDQAEPHPKEIK
jgi:hypothetical protein